MVVKLMSSAPGELELVRAFLNTTGVESGSDKLTSPAELVAWLSERLLLASGASADEQDLERSTGATRGAARALPGELLGRARSRGAAGARRGSRARRASPSLRRGRRGEGGAERRGRRRSARAPAGDRRRVDAGRHLGAAQGLSQRRVPLGLLRRLEEPLACLVLDGRSAATGPRLDPSASGRPAPDGLATGPE